MKSVIPFKKEIEFKTKIAEISSISLEHEYVVNEGELKGDFVVFGDYKIHEVSVNKEIFKYRLPFCIELTDNVDLDSISFEILDFTYEVVDDDKLEVFVEFSVQAEEVKREVEFEEVKAGDLDLELEGLLPVRESVREEPVEVIERVEEPSTVEVVSEEEVRDEITLEEAPEDSYITYHIHIVKESESIESICAMYGTNVSSLGEYNDLSNIVVGDKVIIPEVIDE